MSFTGTDISIPRSPFLSAGDEFGPGAENLQLLLDWEDYTTGADLSNVYPDNSGIQSLTANNNPGVETTSPIIGQQSGDYTAANSEYHSSTGTIPLTPTTDVYVAVWVRVTNTQAYFIAPLNNGGNGFTIRNDINGSALFQIIQNNNDAAAGSTDITTGEFFLEGVYRSASGELEVRVDGTTEATTTTADTVDTSVTITVAAFYGNNALEGALDNGMIEAAPQGELFWPDHSDFLITKPSAQEILQYNP